MIVNDIEIMFGGQAGDGSLTTGDLIAGMFKRMGLEVYTYKDFPSRIRGGHTNYVIRAGERPHYGMADFVDGLVAFDLEAVEVAHRRDASRRFRHLRQLLASNVPDAAAPQRRQLVRNPAREDRQGASSASRLVRNTISLGALAKLIGMDPAIVRDEVAGVYRARATKSST